jgi:hypothetical protein
MTVIRPTIHLVAYSTTGKSPASGKVDTCFGILVRVEDEWRKWIVPLKSATMNQAALLGLKFGIAAIKQDKREFLLVVTDNPYLHRVLERKGADFPFKAESNVELVKEIRDAFQAIPSSDVRHESPKKLTAGETFQLYKHVREVGKARLGK